MPMYDMNKILPGLIVFFGLVTFPIWYNHGNAGHVPKPEKPTNAKECIRPTAEMRTSHMVILNQFRDEVVRESKRGEIKHAGGVEYDDKSLMLGCMKCHTSTKKFCDECHTYAAVQPYCWDCHIQPKETN